jgi:hypothetical protein
MKKVSLTLSILAVLVASTYAVADGTLPLPNIKESANNQILADGTLPLPKTKLHIV